MDLELGLFQRRLLYIFREREKKEVKLWFSIQRNVPILAYDSYGANSTFITDTIRLIKLKQ